jgi:hypothetical protein
LDNAACDRFRFPLGSRVVVVHLDVGGGSQKRTSSGGCLLSHMSQLVSQQLFSCLCSRRILVRSKYHITFHGVGEGVHGPRRFRIPGIRVHTHATEVTPEARLHKVADFRIERLSRKAQHLVNDRWHTSRLRTAPVSPLQAPLLLPALLALSPAGVLAARTLALKHAAQNWWLTLSPKLCCHFPIHSRNPFITATWQHHARATHQ